MGLIQRIRRITVSRIEAVLASVEDPDLVFPQLVREMEDQVRAATDAEAKAMASVKAAQRELDQVREKIARMEKGTESALSRGDEDTAREAVSVQINLESDISLKENAVSRSQVALEDAREAREQLQQQLEELRAKKSEILTRARVAKNQKRVEKTVSGPVSSAKSILDTVAQLESKVEEEEAELEIRREMGAQKGSPSLEKRLSDLETGTEIERRLADLKKAMGKQDGS